MIPVQHFIPISGGKDSTAALCLALERFERRPPPANLPPRFIHCDVGSNEHQATIDHIAYLSEATGVDIEIIRADFSAEFATRRANIRADWSREKRIKKHSPDCRASTAEMAWGQARAHRLACGCPINVMPVVAEADISEAIALLVPSGDPFLDLCMLKGRFPGAKSRFCTEELKIAPMMAIKRPIWADGISTIEWVGERADESPARALKPVIQRIRHGNAAQILYRPCHKLSAQDVFDIAKRHGLRPNPLYLIGAKRVGCWPCIMCGKDEIINIATRTPEHIERLRAWEALVSRVSRRRMATFFHASDETMFGIDQIIAWGRTSRGGKQFDIFRSEQAVEADIEGAMCDSGYGLCE